MIRSLYSVPGELIGQRLTARTDSHTVKLNWRGHLIDRCWRQARDLRQRVLRTGRAPIPSHLIHKRYWRLLTGLPSLVVGGAAWDFPGLPCNGLRGLIGSVGPGSAGAVTDWLVAGGGCGG